MKILLTGGSGFIGRNIVEFYKTCSDILIDAPNSLELDCLDESAVRNRLLKEKYDIVLNFAGYSPVGSGKPKDANKIFEYNMRMFMNFAKYSNLYKKMFWIGSGAEYGRNTVISKVKENDLIKYAIPNDQYGLEKYCIGKYIEYSANIYNLRLFGIFGPYEFAEKRFVSNMILDAINQSDYVIKQNCRFDYLWIYDFLNILDKFLYKEILNYHTYNISSGNSYELYELAEMVRDLSGWKGNIIIENKKIGNEYTCDNSRLITEFPNLEFSSMEEAIKELIVWYSTKK